MNLLEVLIGTNTIAIIFGAGALWQKVKGLDDRVGRIEDTMNGLLQNHLGE